MSTKKDLETARAAYATSLRQLAAAALRAVERGPLIWSDPLEQALSVVSIRHVEFRTAHDTDRAADLAQLPKAE